jgi:hypothetical protein
MENLTGYTSTQLLKMLNDINVKHKIVRQEIIDMTFQVDELEININNKITELTELEKNYVLFIDEMSKR